MSPKSKPYNQFPYDETLSPQSKQCLDWVVTQLNQLIGQGAVPPGQNLQAFGSNIVDPTSAQIVSAGSRMSSIATGIAFATTTTSVTFYWDGTNGSKPFQIYRDDGTVFGPSITGSPYAVTGLSPSTQYFFYPYFDESVQQIKFSTIGGVSVGSPAIAFTTQNNLAAQQQILRGHIPLAFLLSSTGVTTPGAGTTTGFGGSGGGGAGVGGNGRYSL